MMLDEEEPKKQRDYTLGEKLEDFSISDLEELKLHLEHEIARVEAETARKNATKIAAASIFKK